MRTLLTLAFVLVACRSSEPPSKVQGAPTRPPDESYEIGGGHATRVLVWRCDARNERVSMMQSCAEGLTGCGAWKIDRTLCPLDEAGRAATRTSSESTLSRNAERRPIPEGSGWR